jgi:hypothetical protein
VGNKDEIETVGASVQTSERNITPSYVAAGRRAPAGPTVAFSESACWNRGGRPVLVEHDARTD